MTEICDTGITWDHDTGQVWVSTRRKGIASKLQKLGFEPQETGPNGYTNFTADEEDLRISFRRPKKMTQAQRKAAATRMKAVRS